MKTNAIYVLIIYLSVITADAAPLKVNSKDSIPTSNIKKKRKAYIKKKAIPIKSIESEDFSDLLFFKELVKNKRIVILGESSHNIAEFNKLKTRLIKFFHEQMGFEVLAFEDGLAEMFLLNESKNYLTPDSMLKSSLFPFWQVQENIPLMNYLKKSKIITTGFDYQYSSYKTANLFIYKYLSPLNPEMVNNTFSIENVLFNKEIKNYIEYRRIKDSLVNCYRQLNELVHQNEEKLRTNLSRDEFMTIKKVLQNRLLYTSLLGTGEFTSEKRDEVMANNLVWLADTLYPDKKILIWAHNAHIYKAYPDNAPSNRRIMIAEMPEKFKKESYDIGLYMYKGKTGMSPVFMRNVSRIKHNTLESFLHQSGYPTTFLDFSNETPNDSNLWMFRSIEALEWGRHSKEKLIMKKTYDGVILLDRVIASIPLSIKK